MAENMTYKIQNNKKIKSYNQYFQFSISYVTEASASSAKVLAFFLMTDSTHARTLYRGGRAAHTFRTFD